MALPHACAMQPSAIQPRRVLSPTPPLESRTPFLGLPTLNTMAVVDREASCKFNPILHLLVRVAARTSGSYVDRGFRRH